MMVNAFITVYFESADLGGGVLEVGAAGELAADVVLLLLGPGLPAPLRPVLELPRDQVTLPEPDA